MNYFKPDKYYYIIPILKIDLGLMLGEEKSLYEYVKDNFPILRQLDNERAEILYGSNVPTVINSEYLKHQQLITDSLEALNLPKYILALGNEFEAIEPVTGKKITQRVNDNITLKSYRVSDCELESYYISDYEKKVNNFFKPDITTLDSAKKNKQEFINIIEKNKNGKALTKERNKKYDN